MHAQLCARLAPAKLPRYVAVVDEVPYGPTQRVLREVLPTADLDRAAVSALAGLDRKSTRLNSSHRT